MTSTNTRRFGLLSGAALAGLMMAMCAGVLTAQTNPSGDTESDSSKVDLSNWWLKNAITFSPIPQQWLFHAELDYTFSYQTGNIDGVTHQGQTGLYLRKGRATLATRALISTQRLSIANGAESVSAKQYMVSPTFDYAVTTWIGPEIGLWWEKNSAAFIDQRAIAYAGLDINPVSGPGLIVSVLPAFGYLHEEALLTGETRWFWAPYIEEEVTWPIHNGITLHHTANALVSIDGDNGYRTRMKNTLAVPIGSVFSVTLNHTVGYNSNPVPTQEAVDAVTGGEGTVYKTDTDLTIGLRIQY